MSETYENRIGGEWHDVKTAKISGILHPTTYHLGWNDAIEKCAGIGKEADAELTRLRVELEIERGKCRGCPVLKTAEADNGCLRAELATLQAERDLWRDQVAKDLAEKDELIREAREIIQLNIYVCGKLDSPMSADGCDECPGCKSYKWLARLREKEEEHQPCDTTPEQDADAAASRNERLRGKEGGKVLCDTCADRNQCSGVGSKKTKCAIYKESK